MSPAVHQRKGILPLRASRPERLGTRTARTVIIGMVAITIPPCIPPEEGGAITTRPGSKSTSA